MATNDQAALGMAILTSFVLNDRAAGQALLEDLDPNLALALLARSAQVAVDILAQALGLTREQAMALVAQSVAVVDQDDV